MFFCMIEVKTSNARSSLYNRVQIGSLQAFHTKIYVVGGGKQSYFNLLMLHFLRRAKRQNFYNVLRRTAQQPNC